MLFHVIDSVENYKDNLQLITNFNPTDVKRNILNRRYSCVNLVHYYHYFLSVLD